MCPFCIAASSGVIAATSTAGVFFGLVLKPLRKKQRKHDNSGRVPAREPTTTSWDRAAPAVNRARGWASHSAEGIEQD